MKIRIILSLLFWVMATTIACAKTDRKQKIDTPQNPILLEVDQHAIIHAPTHPSGWANFRNALDNWKARARKAVAYNDVLYNRDDFDWVKSGFNCYFLMMYDQIFFDRANNRYTVDELLLDGERKFGRYDIVVLWHAYPRIGLDDRNQFDFYRDMPGGLEGLRKVCDRLHEKGVKVYINYNPWDIGTRREGVDDIVGLANIIKAIGADGIFLDTMDKGADEYRSVLDATRAGVVLESELSLPINEIAVHHMSWGQWFIDSEVPGILRNKWFEPRHIQHAISRWNRDKSPELQYSWMNGSGTMVWENVFGQWVGWNPRDQYTLRTMTAIQHRFADMFSSDKWIPLCDSKPITNIYASEWYDQSSKLWTLVNRSSETKEGELLHIDVDDKYNYYDLVRGIQITPNKATKTLSGRIIGRGVGCFYAIEKSKIPADMPAFLASMAALLSGESTNTAYPAITPELKAVASTIKYSTVPTAMVEVPAYVGTQKRTIRVREIGAYKAIEDEFNIPNAPGLHYSKSFDVPVAISRFAIDQTPVTNVQFKAFIDATGYTPRYTENFLKHWADGTIPAGLEDHPVVYVDLDDARAYATWAGKRLPREEEWQMAAAGTNQYRYPWGNEFDPQKTNSSITGATTPVKQFTTGRSPYGAWDMCGNTWELTESERNDGVNRFCMLKGGSCYKAIGSDWYFDGGAQTNDFTAKMYLMFPGLDRCATIGFRCVADLN